MWVVLAFVSALAAGLTAVLSKIGTQGVDGVLATAVRTVVVFCFAWAMVGIVGSGGTIGAIDGRTLAFLTLSGLATGASWTCYLTALRLGQVNRVAAVDRSSTVLTMIMAALFLSEPLTRSGIVGMVLITAGTVGMVLPGLRPAGQAPSGAGEPEGQVPSAAGEPEGRERSDAGTTTARPPQTGRRVWLAWASASAVFAALTSILAKVGIQDVEATLGTAIRTTVVLVAAWALALALGRTRALPTLTPRNWVFLVASGITTGVSWLAFYRALQDGPAGVVVPIDKLSILVTVAFAALVLTERLAPIALAGLVALTAGTLVLLIGV